MIPKPTIGREVWFWGMSTIGVNDRLQPFAGKIIYVHSPSMVNLFVMDHGGGTRILSSVQLRAPNPGQDGHGKGANYATWTPHQMREVSAHATPPFLGTD